MDLLYSYFDVVVLCVCDEVSADSLSFVCFVDYELFVVDFWFSGFGYHYLSVEFSYWVAVLVVDFSSDDDAVVWPFGFFIYV